MKLKMMDRDSFIEDFVAEVLMNFPVIGDSFDGEQGRSEMNKLAEAVWLFASEQWIRGNKAGLSEGLRNDED